MRSRILFSVLLSTTIFSCTSYNNRQTVPDTMEKAKSYTVDSPTNYNAQYAFIIGVIQKNDTNFIDADYIQYLTGQAAIDAAIKHHEADTFKTVDGKIHVDVPNDYFIVNDNKKIGRLPIDKNCVIDLAINPDGNPIIADNSLESLKKIDNVSPFKLTINKQGIVIKIREIFAP